jgi:hypothetical protein
MIQTKRKPSIDEVHENAVDVVHSMVDMLDTTLDNVTKEIATGLTFSAYTAIHNACRALNDDLDDTLFDLRALMAGMGSKEMKPDNELEEDH